MVKKAKNIDTIQLLLYDKKASLDKLAALGAKINALEFRINVAGCNGRKVNFNKLNDYYPKLDALYFERNELENEHRKLSRRLDRMD